MPPSSFDTLRAEIFTGRNFCGRLVQTLQFCGINFCDLSTYLRFCGIDFCGWCLERSQNEAIGGKTYEKNKEFSALTVVLELLTGGLCGGFRFQYSYYWYIGKLELLKRSFSKTVFLGIFQDFQNSSFANIPEKYIKLFRMWFIKNVDSN